ncbi:MAG: SRPBCC domain-containing protein [Mesorhizobium sp.]|nr:SRPBCC domain-containing protein [Mesorhizobium sp.]MCO5160882.1 SRPBCC domain-containing protein [Mesorhizobium sp.]
MEANIDVTGAGGASALLARLPDLTFKRVFDAPIALVFKAWTDPLQVAAWWGPHGFSNPFAAIEPHPGGRFHVHMQAPDGTIQPMGGHFEEIEAPNRMVFVTTLCDEHGSIGIETVHTVTLVGRGARTDMILQSRMVYAAPCMLADVGGMEGGWSQSLERLDAILKAI